jgi:SAM-dependent methyltransferase
VREALVEYLACPDCGGDLELGTGQIQDDHVMEGALHCEPCSVDYPIQRGVPRFTQAHSEGHAATAEAFGWQWKRYPELQQRYRQQFLDWIFPVTPDQFTRRVVLEGGCGKGRHTALAAEFGARAVIAVDLSDAVDPAFANTREFENAHIVQADLNFLPVKPVIDYAFSVGVLHHLPDPERGFRSLVSKLRPGGRLSAWVYGREGNGWIVHLVSPLRKHVTSRLPHRLLSWLATILTVPLWSATRLLFGPAHRRGIRLPYGKYLGYIADFPFAEQRTIVFDHLVAPVAHYLKQEEFSGWFERAGMDQVTIEHHNENSWRGYARIPAGD